jgi:hypothetical protein
MVIVAAKAPIAHGPDTCWTSKPAISSPGQGDGRLYQANEDSGRAALAQGERNGEDHAREREAD